MIIQFSGSLISIWNLKLEEKHFLSILFVFIKIKIQTINFLIKKKKKWKYFICDFRAGARCLQTCPAAGGEQ